ncbi:hypothetical protein CAOG_02253 [Capsaspora owczarzaki ATCC 30864]|uniref:Transcription factor IIIC putative zinc-finger domain-containing protein n=1 Tax=Capsaspora owczarzaki (strain ATCC 30864) TaxID=595528 RepID=A0A0D2U7G0_CAPO3|nr:hypothetical protein CAOG_02253 [Capsaspora owczarzaki ATCC 30864]KJE91056.1 hypothetical protein CAOG_002253 [Capsaspora owczarzaki ATCC 30864]|eukprot:XP_004349003.2 hypothetical protein CAOG_02253 [Capsaspora owczarzaki ATCC 30864]
MEEATIAPVVPSEPSDPHQLMHALLAEALRLDAAPSDTLGDAAGGGGGSAGAAEDRSQSVLLPPLAAMSLRQQSSNIAQQLEIAFSNRSDRLLVVTDLALFVLTLGAPGLSTDVAGRTTRRQFGVFDHVETIGSEVWMTLNARTPNPGQVALGDEIPDWPAPPNCPEPNPAVAQARLSEIAACNALMLDQAYLKQTATSTSKSAAFVEPVAPTRAARNDSNAPLESERAFASATARTCDVHGFGFRSACWSPDDTKIAALSTSFKLALFGEVGLQAGGVRKAASSATSGVSPSWVPLLVLSDLMLQACWHVDFGLPLTPSAAMFSVLVTSNLQQQQQQHSQQRQDASMQVDDTSPSSTSVVGFDVRVQGPRNATRAELISDKTNPIPLQHNMFVANTCTALCMAFTQAVVSIKVENLNANAFVRASPLHPDTIRGGPLISTTSSTDSSSTAVAPNAPVLPPTPVLGTATKRQSTPMAASRVQPTFEFVPSGSSARRGRPRKPVLEATPPPKRGRPPKSSSAASTPTSSAKASPTIKDLLMGQAASRKRPSKPALPESPTVGRASKRPRLDVEDDDNDSNANDSDENGSGDDNDDKDNDADITQVDQSQDDETASGRDQSAGETPGDQANHATNGNPANGSIDSYAGEVSAVAESQPEVVEMVSDCNLLPTSVSYKELDCSLLCVGTRSGHVNLWRIPPALDEVDLRRAASDADAPPQSSPPPPPPSLDAMAMPVLTFLASDSWVNCLSWCPGNRLSELGQPDSSPRLAVASSNGRVVVWDLELQRRPDADPAADWSPATICGADNDPVVSMSWQLRGEGPVLSVVLSVVKQHRIHYFTCGKSWSTAAPHSGIAASSVSPVIYSVDTTDQICATSLAGSCRLAPLFEPGVSCLGTALSANGLVLASVTSSYANKASLTGVLRVQLHMVPVATSDFRAFLWACLPVALAPRASPHGIADMVLLARLHVLTSPAIASDHFAVLGLLLQTTQPSVTQLNEYGIKLIQCGNALQAQGFDTPLGDANLLASAINRPLLQAVHCIRVIEQLEDYHELLSADLVCVRLMVHIVHATLAIHASQLAKLANVESTCAVLRAAYLKLSAVLPESAQASLRAQADLVSQNASLVVKSELDEGSINVPVCESVEQCPICHSDLRCTVYLEGVCAKGHSFARCPVTLVPLAKPGAVCAQCGVERSALFTGDVPDAQSPWLAQLLRDASSCLFCGGSWSCRI